MIRKLNKVRIPMKEATCSDSKRPLVMIQSGHLFRTKEATQYDESGHPRRSRQATLVFSSITLLPPPV
jgi:hypothetical protein